MDRIRFAGAFLLLAGCAGVSGETGPSWPEGRPVALSRSTGAPGTDALLAEFYGPSLQPATFEPKLRAALGAHPDDADLHEMELYLDVLKGDQEGCVREELLALLDSRAAAPLLWIHALPYDEATVVPVLRELAAHSPDAALRGKARWLLLWSDLDRGDWDDAQRQRAALGLVTRFSVVGPFDNDDGKGFYTAYPPELGIDLGATYPGTILPVRWRQVEALGASGEVPLEGMLWPFKGQVAYATSWLTVPAAVDGTLWIGTGGPVRVFLDGKHAISAEHLDNEGLAYETLGLRVHLAPGPHVLLVKLAPRSGRRWLLSARLVGADGAPPAGLVQADRPPAVPLAASTFEPIPPVHGLRPDVGGARAHLLAARMAAVVVGDPELEMRETMQFVDAARGSPLALWAMARAAEDEDEQGKRIDAIEEGVRRFGDSAPAFYALRAEARLAKDLLEKAGDDAEAFLRLRPHELTGQMLLAAVQDRRKLAVERCHTAEQEAADHPGRIGPLRALADCRADQGQLGDSIALLRHALTLLPHAEGTERPLCRAYLRARRLDDAADLAAALRRDWRYVIGDLTLSATIASDAGDQSGAEAFLREAHRRSPDDPQPLARLAELESRRGRTAQVDRLWAEASDRDPGNELYAERAGRLTPTTLGFLQKYVPTDAELQMAIAEGAKRVPKAGSQSLLLLDDEVTEVHADGSSTHLITQVERAVNDPGRDSLLQFHLPGGVVKVLDAYVVAPDGTRTEASSVHKPSIHFRDFDVGATRVIRFIWHERGWHFLPNEFTQDWSFQSPNREHVLSHWTLVVPKGKTLHVSLHGGIQQTVVEEQGRAIYQFVAHDVPPLVPEPHATPLRDLLWRASVSTVPSWDDFTTWERALLADAFQPSDDLAALAKKLTAGATTPAEKLDRLSAWVAEKIRYQMDYEKPIAGVRPHSARQVLERRYADCKDKAVLLIALGREVGVALDFALVRTFPMGRTDKEVPNQQFNHAIVYVPKQPGFDAPRFVDATTNGLDVGNLRADDQGTTSLVIDPLVKTGWQFVDIPFRPAAQEAEQSRFDVAVAPDGTATVAADLRLRGTGASMLRHFLKTPADGRKVEEQIASSYFPGSTLVEAKSTDPTDVTRPLDVTLGFTAPDALQTEGRVKRLRLRAALDLESLTALATRQLPLWLGAPREHEWAYSVRLPAGSRVSNVPESFREEARCLSIERDARRDGDRIDVRVREVRSCPEISPAEYPAFRARTLEALNRLDERVAFSPGPVETAPAR